MQLVFLAVGDELLRAESREGNGYELAQQLAARGLALAQMRVLPDDRRVIQQALAELTLEPGVVLVSGGLGPTQDDFTREAVAQAAGVPLQTHTDSLEALQQRFARMGRTMHPANAQQAEFPGGATVLTNDFGTAPGFVLPVGRAEVVCLPGVPREFAGMLQAHLDTVLGRVGLTRPPRDEVTLRVFGIPEADLQGLLQGLPHWGAAHFRSLPTWPEIRVKLARQTDNYPTLLQEVRAALGLRIYGEGDDDTMAMATLRALQDRGATLAMAESCTGGLLGHMLTDVPGASRTHLLDAVTYSNTAKAQVLGVPDFLLRSHGAVSEPVAQAMAEGARRLAGATVAVATTGIAGPGGGSDDKPVGTVCLALASETGTVTQTLHFRGVDRRRWKVLVAFTALDQVRRWALAAQL
jgi:nicotinamide-nucleotide amidase